ncbi:hypothetical protein CIC12_28915 [Burkholderia sp. SG-MS1]|uniref:LysR substrate-binding domain-containing protein n=1 Tax=Paraburkholderia sp. SG-MS1 TaxID=2023741 RepID=UPI001446363F|nr:LysR substrate-binding domain-containing protein [Paraburkholderia sp. SG-MS1]NKJ50675.1 hypothetical protein [Paraburkholderia sp. SG-MS1]
MKLNQLRALVAISETGSFHEAARNLHLTQPALSKTIKELEASLDAKLLERFSTGTRLTPYGQRLVSHARFILQCVKKAGNDIALMKGMGGGQVTVGITPLAGALSPMIAAIEHFQHDHPDVELRLLEMRPLPLVEQLRQGLIDFAVTTQWNSQDRFFHSTELCRRSSVVAARKDHILRGAGSLRALQRAEWMTIDPLGDRTSPFHRLFSDNGLDMPTRVTECSSVLLALELCSRSDQLIVLSSESLSSTLVTERLIFVNVSEAVPDQSICLLQHRQQILTGAAQQFHSELLSRFGENI